MSARRTVDLEIILDDLYQPTQRMTHPLRRLVSRAGLVGRPRAKKDSRARGWWGGRAPKKTLIPSVILYDAWYRARGWWGGRAPKKTLIPRVILYDAWYEKLAPPVPE